MAQTVFRHFMEQIKDVNSHTPDFLELKKDKNDEFLVFIYGSMKKHKPLHSLVMGANYYGKGVTTGCNYLLKKTAKEGSPILFDIANKWTKTGAFISPNDTGKIEGEVYGVPLRAITKIDRVEDNGQATSRLKRYVRLTEQEHKPIVSTFVWLAERDFWEETVASIITLPGGIKMTSGGETFFYYA